jgi:hypothetical protein
MLRMGGGQHPLASLKIPDQILPGVAVLNDIPEESYTKFLSALQQSPTTFSTRKELVAWIAPQTPEISSGDIEKIIDSLSAFYRVLQRAKISVADLVQDVLVSTKRKAIKIDDGTLSERLLSLIPIDSLNVIEMKAKELQMQGERLLVEARVITDARPIFGDTIGDSPVAMVVIQSLKLRFFEPGTGEFKDLHFSLDGADIRSLKETLDRAEEKARSLKGVFAKSDLKVVELE